MFKVKAGLPRSLPWVSFAAGSFLTTRGERQVPKATVPQKAREQQRSQVSWVVPPTPPQASFTTTLTIPVPLSSGLYSLQIWRHQQCALECDCLTLSSEGDPEFLQKLDIKMCVWDHR